MKFLDFFLPNRCLECDEIIDNEEIICPNCWDKIRFTHWEFGDNPLKQKAEILFPVQNAFALMYFDSNGLARNILHRLKYSGMEKIGKVLVKRVADKVEFRGNKPDLIVSVPLHHKKLKIRGYNQLHLFVETLSEIWQIPYHHHILQRASHQDSQASKGKSGRENAKYDFILTQNIENKHILIVDDVFTTGNTMSAVAWEFLKNKTNQVSILVMAMD